MFRCPASARMASTGIPCDEFSGLNHKDDINDLLKPPDNHDNDVVFQIKMPTRTDGILSKTMEHFQQQN